MNIFTYSEHLAQKLHPKPYTNRMVYLPDDIHLLLTHKKWMSARYAIAVTAWNPTLDGPEFLKAMRGKVSRQLSAMWVFREVGLYLVVCGAESDWQSHVSNMRADKTGLHSVIVQAVHFVDLQTGATKLNQSAWGPVKFGGVDSVANIVNSISLSGTHHLTQ